jgi:hypothetical protein
MNGRLSKKTPRRDTLFEKGAGRSPAERPFRKLCGIGGTSRTDFLHTPLSGSCAAPAERILKARRAGLWLARRHFRRPSGTIETSFKSAPGLLRHPPIFRESNSTGEKEFSNIFVI